MNLEITKILLEIFLIAWLIYGIINFIRGTRANFILTGFFAFSIATTLFSQILDLTIINYLIGKIWGFVPILMAIVFQSEIRHALAILGSQQFRRYKNNNVSHLKTIVNTCFYLAHNKTGALIAIENNIDMRIIKEGGIPINSSISFELLATIFFKNTPLHDGGLIIKNDKIVCAGCVFPLTDKINIPKSLGLRHRAGLGISEETDCVCIIISEETGFVSIAINGKFTTNINETQLLHHLIKYSKKEDIKLTFLENLQKRLFPKKGKNKNEII